MYYIILFLIVYIFYTIKNVIFRLPPGCIEWTGISGHLRMYALRQPGFNYIRTVWLRFRR